MKLDVTAARPGLAEKVGYGLGDFSSSMFWKIFSYYLPIFYSDVFGLKAQHAALLLLITKLYDAISDPVMGIIADRTRSRWGKYRPYLLWVALPFAVIGVLSFYTPDWSYSAKHVYAYVMYILMMTVYTAINVPYGAMLGVVSPDPREKSVFSSYRMFFAYIGSFLAMGIFALFERNVTGKPDAQGVLMKGVGDASPASWTFVVGIVAVLCFLLFLGCFALTRERVRQEEKSSGAASVRSDLKALLGNGPWWLLLGGGVCILLFNSIRGGAAAYYFANIIGANPLVTCALYLMIGEIAQMLGVLLAVPVSDRIGKKGTFIAVLAVVSVLSVLVWFLPETASGFWMLLLLQVLIGLAVGVNSPMLWSMFADVADYSELKHGNPSTGLIFSSSSMAQKFGGALGAFLLMQILAWSGYDAALAQQSEGTLRAIKALMSFVPAAGSLLGLLCLVFYPLGSAKMRAVQSELETKRNK